MGVAGMMVHRGAHGTDIGLRHRRSRGHVRWRPVHTRRPRVTCEVWALRGGSILHGLSAVHLGHAADSTAPQSWVLVAIPPAVDRPLDESALPAEGRVEMRQRPADRVALRLVDLAVALV